MTRLGLAFVILAGTVAGQAQNASTLNASVGGTVLGTNGVPLGKASISLQPAGGGPRPVAQPYSATSDGSGRFYIGEIAPGSYLLAADHLGYIRGTYGQGRSLTILNLLPGDNLTDLKLQLVEQAVVTGKVVDQDGDPVRAIQVRLLHRTYANGRRQLMPMGFSQANDIGEFRISGVAAGQYYVVAEPAPRQPNQARRPRPPGELAEEQPVLTFYPGAPDPAGAVPLRVSAGETLTAITIHLAKAAAFSIRGTVTGLEGSPGAYRVLLTPKSDFSSEMAPGGTTNYATQIDKDGHFQTPEVPSGTWNVHVTRNGQGPPSVVASREIALNSDIDDLTLAATQPASIQGTVRIEKADGSPDLPPGALRIELRALDEPIALPLVQAKDNQFTLPTAGAGRYQVRVLGMPEGGYLKYILFGGRDAMSAPFTMGEGGGGQMEIVLGSPSAQIFGTLLGADGNAAPGGVVSIAPDPVDPERFDLFRRASTDQTGQFTIRDLAPGKYRVYGWSALDNGEEADPDVLKQHEDKSSAVTLSEGDRTLITITAQ